MKRLLEQSRHIVLLAVAGTFFSAISLFIFGFVGVAASIFGAISKNSPFDYTNLKLLSVELIQTIDIFLLATVFYIIALGLYELFIDDKLTLPDWLVVHTIEDLEARLLGVVVVLLPVTFFGKLVESNKGLDILWFGLSVAIVLGAVGFAQYIATIKHNKHDRKH